MSAQSCCDDPDPRFLEKNGRMFCNNCHRYLDHPPSAPRDDDEAEAPAPEGDEKT